MAYKTIPNDTLFKSRFLAKVAQIRTGDNDCWNWQWAKACSGYGTVRISKKAVFLAHRVSFFLHNGYLNPNLVIDHTCSNRQCINPKHLTQTTIAKNLQIDRVRFPEKYHKAKFITLIPKLLVSGACKHGHVIQSYADLKWWADGRWKCRRCYVGWYRHVDNKKERLTNTC